MKLASAIFLTALLAAANASARVDAVYIDKGLLGPRLPEAGPLAEPFLEHKLAAHLTEALRARRIKVLESSNDPAPNLFGLGTLYVSLSYTRIPDGTTKPERYRGYSLYVSQRDPAFERSLGCSWQVGHALSKAGEKPWSNRTGNAPPLLDPAGVRGNDSMTAPKFVKGPSVFLEAGVMVSEEEVARLAEPATLQKMADAIAEGIDNCTL
ncbi:N-acetylmuramoyl-L-alanine amidase [Massilia jejuensis]|uniref:N-acetylmuramoyl-L-alanine amidase n=1 Tax=Massilia jejuensis TaxID=648894 RepID=A0ABW0PED0_9BURK